MVIVLEDPRRSSKILEVSKSFGQAVLSLAALPTGVGIISTSLSFHQLKGVPKEPC
jgi:hypothetical protein